MCFHSGTFKSIYEWHDFQGNVPVEKSELSKHRTLSVKVLSGNIFVDLFVCKSQVRESPSVLVGVEALL
jgi:hypothetical protein